MHRFQPGRMTVDELKRLCVPLERCLSVTTGEVDLSIVAELEARQFDQAPVYHQQNSKCVIGLVETERLRILYDSGKPLMPDDPIICQEDQFFRIGVSVQVEEIFERMSKRRALLVVEGFDDGWIFGLLTISDLNRQPLRAALYSLLAELEAGMASLVEGLSEDPWSWLVNLNEEYQVQVLGYWELSKRKGVAISPVAALTITQLIQILTRKKEILQRLDYSRTAFENETGKIPRLRNCVMHPVRPLVLGQEDVSKVLITIRFIAELFARVESCGPRDSRRR